MPTLCGPVSKGGLGFEYRMNMGYPDKITDLIENRKSELDWGMGELVHALCFRRKSEVRAVPGRMLVCLLRDAALSPQPNIAPLPP